MVLNIRGCPGGVPLYLPPCRWLRTREGQARGSRTPAENSEEHTSEGGHATVRSLLPLSKGPEEPAS